MKTSLLFLIISSIPMIDILISFKTNQYAKTLPKTKIGRSLFALISTISCAYDPSMHILLM